MKSLIPVFLLLILAVREGRAQTFWRPLTDTYKDAVLRLPTDTVPSIVSDDLFYLPGERGCKSLQFYPIPMLRRNADSVVLVSTRKKVTPKPVLPVPAKSPLISVHGNVMYDFYYQSNADTPFVEKDLHQHTLQTTLEITVRDRYPLRLTFNTAKGNSAYFRNITGANLKYDQRDFRNLLIRRVMEWSKQDLPQMKALDSLKRSLDLQWNGLAEYRKWFDGEFQMRKRIEAREEDLYGKTKMRIPDYNPGGLKIPAWADSVKVPEKMPGDSAYRRLMDDYARRRKQLDSLEMLYARAEKYYRNQQQMLNDRKMKMQQVLERSRNNTELADNLETLKLPDTVLPKGYRSLLAIRSIGIGRSMADYSELTVKNISITGFQAEYNPSYYLAFATGAVDYRFRDFSVSQGRIKQYVTLVRGGLGQRDGHHLFLTYYTGRKQLYNINTLSSDSLQLRGQDYRVMGLSLEGRWQLGKNVSLTGEAAKSSMPYYRRAADKESLPGSMVNFGDRSNEAFSMTADALVPRSKTRLQGMYRVMGADFQSFSFYNSGSSQNAWMLKADQPFFKQQLTLTASVRKNVFNSLFEQSGYESSTIFKSIQATFRRKNWPVVTLGYFPTSQLMKLDNDLLVENMFYTLSGTISHFYRYRDVSMNTLFSGTRFYNRNDDTAFVYFNSTNLALNQTVFMGPFTLSGGWSSAFNPEYDLHGVDGSVQYNARWFGLGGGLKYNYQTVYDLQQLGYSANVRVNIPKLGEISLMGDRGFVPGVNKRLVPNETGRLTYTKIF